MKIRDFEPADQEICKEIHISSATAEGFDPKIIESDFDDDIFSRYITTGGLFKVVEVDSKIIAFGGISVVP